MGVIGFEINGNSASTLHHGWNSFSSYAIPNPISSRPFFGNALNARVARKFQFRVSRTAKLSFGPVIVSLNGGSNAGLLPKELEFKPSFDEYLKAMESAKTVRGKKHADDATIQKQKTRGKGDEGKVNKKIRRVGEKIDRKDGFEAAKEDVALKECSSISNGKVRGTPTKGFKNKYDEKGSKLDVKAKQKHGGKIRQDAWSKRQSRGLEPESDDCSVVKSQGKSGSGRISNNIIRSNSNGSRGNVVERGVTSDLYSSKMSREKVVSSRQRDYNAQSKTPGGDKILASTKVMDGRLGGRHTEIESLINRNGPANIKLNMSSKRFVARDYDSDNVDLERAAFKNLDDNNVISKQQFSHKAMEERIQKLARLLNGADINLPEWVFSKMIRSAKLKFNDYSITRVIILLGKLGNWRRVIQVIEWLQRRERFKSYKLRHIYTAALDALGKSRRPVEALNVFHAMQQQMSSYPDLVAYHSIAVTLGQAGHMKELFDVIDIMRSPPKKKFKTGILEKWDPRLEPDIIVYNAVLNACVKRKQWEGAFWVLQELKKLGKQLSASTYGLIMEVMFSCGKYNLVHDFFRKLQKSSIPNSLTYRVLVNTFWKEEKTDEAVLAVQEMERRGIVGSASLYYDLARCLCAAGRTHEALMQIDKICKVANKPLVVTYTGLMQASLDSGKIQDGAYIFKKMKEICAPNLVTYNIILKAYLEHGMFQEAKELFEQMSENTNHLRENTDYKMRVIPDIYTFNTILDACVAQKRWDYFDHVYQRMLCHGYHFNPKRHLRMVLEASRAGKEGPLEITWKHLTDTDRILPTPLIMERFFVKLEKDDYVASLTCITNNPQKDLLTFSKSSWLNLFKENSQRFKKDTLVRLMNDASNIVSNSSLPNPILVYLIQSCKEFLLATDLIAADIDSVKNVSAVESKQVVAHSR
ncbi:pentatricopeptide repeat-containing protein At1g30610, chloroplastic [Gastrolobium bilobum]|uniref:pentatricopeptide repeat-containing protein At1g30610, chloroplastic n=1 Tax=Gastrolobium bilobum TaxID=150636 RepID=UPI002AB27C39|nr:pentatricopeptide repeat-containing protein At1g30610, chloroplastic [Gastrolobium bilobum]